MFRNRSPGRAGDMDFILQFVLEYFVIIIIAIVSGIVVIILVTACRGHSMWTHREERKRGKYYEEK